MAKKKISNYTGAPYLNFEHDDVANTLAIHNCDGNRFVVPLGSGGAGSGVTELNTMTGDIDIVPVLSSTASPTLGGVGVSVNNNVNNQTIEIANTGVTSIGRFGQYATNSFHGNVYFQAGNYIRLDFEGNQMSDNQNIRISNTGVLALNGGSGAEMNIVCPDKSIIVTRSVATINITSSHQFRRCDQNLAFYEIIDQNGSHDCHHGLPTTWSGTQEITNDACMGTVIGELILSAKRGSPSLFTYQGVLFNNREILDEIANNNPEQYYIKLRIEMASGMSADSNYGDIVEYTMQFLDEFPNEYVLTAQSLPSTNKLGNSSGQVMPSYDVGFRYTDNTYGQRMLYSIFDARNQSTNNKGNYTQMTQLTDRQPFIVNTLDSINQLNVNTNIIALNDSTKIKRCGVELGRKGGVATTAI